MEYLIKVSAIITIFYIIYKVLLQRETFFEQNRWFLLMGLFTAFLLPFLVIPIYIEATPLDFSHFVFETNPTTKNIEKPFNVLDYLPLVYVLGVLFFSTRFIVQFTSLVLVFVKNKGENIDGYRFIKTTNNVSPFSFFNWIVYNPKQFNETELEQIITHEKVHAKQSHSFDILVTHISCVVLWFNPFIWLYNKDLKQNLEFIADAVTATKTDCKKSYQYTLLKTSMPSHQMALSNPFYNSLIKKRIVMLHKSKSKKINQLKYALVIPALALFLMSFNTEEVYINQQNPSTETLERNNVVEVIISKDFTNADLENLQTKLKQEGYTAKFKGIKRNSNNEITAIKIEINSNSSNANYNSDLGTPISPIVISYFSDGHGVKIGPSIFLNEKISKNKNSTKSTSFILNDLINKYKGSTYFLNGKEITEKELKLLNNITIESVSHYSDKGQNGVVEITTKDAKWETEYKVGKPFDSTIIYKKPRKAKLGLPYSADTIHFNYKQVSYWKRSDGKSESEVIKKDAMKLAIVLDSMRNNLKNKQTINKNSLYIIDGKETKINDIKKGSKLAESIESIKVLIGDDATKAYGNKGKDGVVLITTNKDKQETHVILRKPFDSIPKKGNSSKHIIKLSGEPLYIIDGKEEKEEVFEKLNSDEITSVDVLKGDHAIKKYGEKGKHGVIEITTKKK